MTLQQQQNEMRDGRSLLPGMSTMGRTLPNVGINAAMRQGRDPVGMNPLPGTANLTLTPSQAGGIVEADGSLLHNGQASPEILKTPGEIISPMAQDGGFSGNGRHSSGFYGGGRQSSGFFGGGRADRFVAGDIRNGNDGAGNVGNIITKIEYKPSSGVILKANPDKTTTILGSFDKDMRNIVNEMGNVKSTYFGAKKGGFNVLNVPDDMYKSADQFWNDVNKPWLDEVIKRGDDIVLATKPTGRAISYIDINTGKEKITGFGREYKYLLDNGYGYDALTNMMIKK